MTNPKAKRGRSKEKKIWLQAVDLIDSKDNILPQGKKLHYIVVNPGKKKFTPDDTGSMRVIFRDDDKISKSKLNDTRRMGKHSYCVEMQDNKKYVPEKK
ncbi:hypothetical protein QUF76_09295 [Desulfobacterales bacterium HSG16]|nr:hypothetical protein [Desulfobacterales bacterium HSG16]